MAYNGLSKENTFYSNSSFKFSCDNAWKVMWKLLRCNFWDQHDRRFILFLCMMFVCSGYKFFQTTTVFCGIFCAQFLWGLHATPTVPRYYSNLRESYRNIPTNIPHNEKFNQCLLSWKFSMSALTYFLSFTLGFEMNSHALLFNRLCTEYGSSLKHF